MVLDIESGASTLIVMEYSISIVRVEHSTLRHGWDEIGVTRCCGKQAWLAMYFACDRLTINIRDEQNVL